MKKKVLSIVLAVAVILCVFPFGCFSAFAEEQVQEQKPETTQVSNPEYLCETIHFNYDDTAESAAAESEHFTLAANDWDYDGWFLHNYDDFITITPKNNENLFIRNIEAVVSYFGEHYKYTGVSSGTKREPGEVEDGSIVHVDSVNEYYFYFNGGSYIQFKDITVFYQIHTHAPTEILKKEATETEHGVTTTHYYCEGCGLYFADEECKNEIPKETAESYIVHKWSDDWLQGDAKGHIKTCTYAGCNATKTVPHTGHDEDGICDVCNYSGTFAETIYFNNNNNAESENFQLYASKCDENGWYGGSENIDIFGNNNLFIERIEALVGDYCGVYGAVGISSGTKREFREIECGMTAHIDDVKANSFSFGGGNESAQFKDITVFYEVHTHNPTLILQKEASETEHGISEAYYYCEGCGLYYWDETCEYRISEEDFRDQILIHNWSDEWQPGDAMGHIHTCTYQGCDVTEKEPHTGHTDNGICDVCGYSGIFAETIVFDYSCVGVNEQFMLEANYCDYDGWWGGDQAEYVTITPTNCENLVIKSIEAKVVWYGEDYSDVGISSGTKRETGNVSNGTTVHIDNVNAYTFSFEGGDDYVVFGDITVYYEAHVHTPTEILKKEATETEHGVTTTHYYCEGCGLYFAEEECKNEIPKETAESYIVHKWSDWSSGDAKGHIRTCTYAGCDETQMEEHTGYIEDGVCDVCEHSGIFAETIFFNNDSLAYSEHFTLNADSYNFDGWYGGSKYRTITITLKNSEKLYIRNIEAVAGCYSEDYSGVGVSSGTKREQGRVEDGTTVHIDDVNATTFSFAEGSDYSQFKDITVFYELHDHENEEFLKNHATVSYEWSTDPCSCTASLICDVCHEVLKSETLSWMDITVVNIPAEKCTENSCVYYIAEFENELFGTDESEKYYFDPGPHKYDFEGYCIYCFAEQTIEDASKDAIKAIHNAVDHSDDELVNLIADKAEDAINEAETIADVLKIKNDTILKINAIVAINEAAGSKPSRSVQRIVDGAKEDISNAENIEDVETIRDECLADIEKLTGGAHTHTYSENWSCDPYYHWHDSICGHDVVSGFGEHDFETATENGITTYTCKVCGYKEYDYGAGDTETEPASGTVGYYGISLTLSSDISINFYMLLTEEQAQNGVMTFTVGDKTFTATAQYNETEKKYFFRCPLNTLQIATTVTAKFTLGGETYTKQYSVKEYCATVIANADGKFDTKSIALCEKIANYGYFAQTYLATIHAGVIIGEEGYTEMTQYGSLDIDAAKTALAGYGFTDDCMNKNISGVARSLNLDDKIGMNFYITVQSGYTLTENMITVSDNREFTLEKTGSNQYRITVKNIEAKNFATNYTLNIDGEIITASVLSYANKVVNGDYSTEFKNSMAALYEYYTAATDFANK